MNVLVTGSRGYVGSVVCDYLEKQGIKVTGYDAGFFEGKDFVPRRDGHFVKKDIREIGRSDFSGIDAVIHLAALSNDPVGNLDPGLTKAVNEEASVNLARMAKDAGVRRFILASSCSVYGVSDGIADETAPVVPLTPYAKSKVEAERRISAYAKNGFSPMFLRSATVYGVSPRMRFDLVLNDFAALAHIYKQIRLNSDGTSNRPLVHVRDLARAYHHLLVVNKDQVHNQAFNLAQDNRQVLELAEMVSEAFGDCPVKVGKNDVDVRDYRVSAGKLSKTGFKYEWPLVKGIMELKQIFRKKGLDESMYQDDRFWTVKRYRKLLESGLVNPDLTWKHPTESELQTHMTGWVGD